MTISEVSRKYDISADTLRYYERIGLIPPVPRRAGGVRDLQDDCWGGNGVLKAKIALPRRMARFAAAAFEEGISLPEALSRWARPALARAIERAVPAGRREAERYAIEEAQGLLMENGLELVEFRLICLERGS